MSKTIVQAYLFYGGRCAEALEFYKSALDARVDMVMHYSDSPDPAPPGMLAPGWESKIMHSSFWVGETMIMASDGCNATDKAEGFSLSLTVPTEDEARRRFAALAEGGSVTMPIGKTFWSPCFGMVTDRFGLGWMVTVPDPQTTTP